MADKKFTDLTAGTSAANVGSLVCMSEYDGVSAYTSKKYTITTMKDIIYQMEAEDKISFDSSGTNKVFAEDSSGTQGRITMNGNTIQFDNDAGGYNKAWFYGSATSAAVGFGQDGGSNGTSFHLGTTGSGDYVDIHLAEKEQLIATAYNYTTPAEDTYPMSLSSRQAVLNGATRTNSLALGGVGLTIDQDDTAFMQEARFNSSVSTTALSDANSNLIVQFGSFGADSFYVDTKGDGSEDDGFLLVDSDSAYIGQKLSTQGGALFWSDLTNGVSINMNYNNVSTLADVGVIIDVKDNKLANKTPTITSDAFPVMVGGKTPTVNSGITNAVTLGGVSVTADTDDTAHVANLNTKIDALGATTGTIDLDTAGNGITDGAYKTITATGNVTLNATTAYSTNNSAKWTLEWDAGTGGFSLTLGTNFLTPGGVAVSVSTSANAKDILKFETDSAGKHRLVEHRKAYA